MKLSPPHRIYHFVHTLWKEKKTSSLVRLKYWSPSTTLLYNVGLENRALLAVILSLELASVDIPLQSNIFAWERRSMMYFYCVSRRPVAVQLASMPKK